MDTPDKEDFIVVFDHQMRQSHIAGERVAKYMEELKERHPEKFQTTEPQTTPSAAVPGAA